LTEPVTGRPRWLVLALAVLAAAALVVAGAALAVGTGIGRAAAPADDSVDAGFARDMSTHHQQAVTMAGLVRDRSTDPAVTLLAFDIESSQNNQIGMMQGWLQVWGLPVNSATQQMAWMGGAGAMRMTGNLMPGMATSDQLDELRTLTGTALDVRFLQLMIRHHEGGLPMAQYAVDHAASDPVRLLAGKILQTQTAEIVAMTDMLTTRGGTVLPPP